MSKLSIPRRSSCSLRELAKKAGVDVSTASRALNNDPRISEETAKAIRSIAKSSGYRPKPLRTKRANAIGFIISCAKQGIAEDDFQRRIAWEAQRAFGERNVHLNIESVERGSGELPELVRQNRVDGVILSGHPSLELVKGVARLGMPAVSIGDSCMRLGIPCVYSDSSPATAEAIRALAAKGHRSIAALNLDMVFPTVRRRHEIYLETLSALGLGFNPQLDVSGLSLKLSGGRDGVRELKRRGPMPTAILCCNDWMALGAILELQRMGLRIPEDVSLVGHDNVGLCEELDPALASIGIEEAKVVEEIAKILLRQIEGGPENPRDISIPGRLFLRESVGPAPSTASTTSKT